MNRQIVSSTGLIFALALFLGTNIISNELFTGLRLDLTENGLYTLSDGTERILEKIDEPIHLHFYYSAKQFAGVPQLLQYGRRVRDMLEEYVAAAGGKLRLTVVDPEPFSEAEDRAVAAGIERLPLGNGEAGYLGISGANTVDDEEVLAALSPQQEEALEYELTKMIYNLAEPKKRVIGVLSSLPVFAPPPDPRTGQPSGRDWVVFTLLREFYEVRELDLDDEVFDEDIDTLLVVHPKELSREMLYAIDQFVLNGGKAMVFVDPLAEMDEAQGDPERPGVMPVINSDLEALFEKWGIEFTSDKVVGNLDTAVRVQIGSERGPQEVEYLPWMQLQDELLNRDDFVTNELQVVNVGTAGSLAPREGATTNVIPLISAGENSSLLERDSVIFVRQPQGLLANYVPDEINHVVAARITGEVETAFPDGRPLSETEKRAPQDDDYQSSGTVNVIVVADTDILADRFWMRFSNFGGFQVPDPFANNADFLVNAVDNLGGNDDLIGLRSRGEYARPFQIVLEIQREAEAQFRDREQALQAKLAETEQKLAGLQQQDTGGELLLSDEEKAEIAQFRQEQLKTRKELRAVQHQLQNDIERLGTVLKFVNIALAPLLVVALALVFRLAQGRQRLRGAT
ncbi:MAG: Gldg family protein [Pseudomonadota bacterium]